jgi:hypothetical protein
MLGRFELVDRDFILTQTMYQTACREVRSRSWKGIGLFQKVLIQLSRTFSLLAGEEGRWVEKRPPVNRRMLFGFIEIVSCLRGKMEVKLERIHPTNIRFYIV